MVFSIFTDLLHVHLLMSWQQALLCIPSLKTQADGASTILEQ